MPEDGLPRRVHAHDEERDEDHAQAGEKQKAATLPVIGKSSQYLSEQSQSLLASK